MALVCKECGYKQYDEETIKSYKDSQPHMAEHDIIYYCGACQDNRLINILANKWYTDCLVYNIPVSPSDVKDIVEELMSMRK